VVRYTKKDIFIMESIDKQTVKHIALLSRIRLDDRELESYAARLTTILIYISKLNEIDTKDIQPTTHPLASLKNVFRKDILRKSLAVDEALKNAPAGEDGFFKVPQIIEPHGRAPGPYPESRREAGDK
jgi:aspartyl-tRNA(Asn)/glutamyl-tRNA(Gln) amidotransferase subunit C